MAEPGPASSEPIFNFNAYSPKEIQEAIEKVGIKKANMPFLPCFMLATVAGGGIGLSVLTTAVVKISPDVVTLFFKGVLCNLLVCLGVWIAYAGRSVTDKIVGLILPVSAFVAAGFEHCIANMYFLPLAWLLA